MMVVHTACIPHACNLPPPVNEEASIGAALVIFAIPNVQENWINNSPDPAVREAAKAYYTKIDTLKDKQAKAFEGGVPTARVIRLRGAHFIFLSNEPDVLREMRLFLSGLK